MRQVRIWKSVEWFIQREERKRKRKILGHILLLNFNVLKRDLIFTSNVLLSLNVYFCRFSPSKHETLNNTINSKNSMFSSYSIWIFCNALQCFQCWREFSFYWMHWMKDENVKKTSTNQVWKTKPETLIFWVLSQPTNRH